MALLLTRENYCIICGQAAEEESVENKDKIVKFIKYFSKCTTEKGDGTLTKLIVGMDQQLDNEGEKWTCCGNCEGIVDQFCVVYDQVKELEEQLGRIGDSVVQIIKSADQEDTGNNSLFNEFRQLIIGRGAENIVKIEPGLVTFDTGSLTIDHGQGDEDTGQEYGEDEAVSLKMTRRYDRNEMIKAIKAVKKGISAPQAAKLFNVPIRTLYHKLKSLGVNYNVKAITQKVLEEHGEGEEEDERVRMAVRIKMRKLIKKTRGRRGRMMRKEERLLGNFENEEEIEIPANFLKVKKGKLKWAGNENYQQFNGNLARSAIEAVRNGKSAKEAGELFEIDSKVKQVIGEKLDQDSGVSMATEEDDMIEEEGDAGDLNDEEYFENNFEEDPETSELKEEIEVKPKTVRKSIRKKRKVKRASTEEDEDFNPGRAKKGVFRKYKKGYQESDLIAAIDAVENGELSAPNAARAFGIPSRTIYDRIKRMGIITTRDYGYCTI